MMLCAVVLSLNLATAPDLALRIRSALHDAPVQRGTFEQSKQVKGFRKPLKSSGTYVVTRGQGIVWNTLKPFPSELTVEPTAIASKQGTKELFRVDASKEPAVRLITEMLFAALSGDVESLLRHFEATGQIGPEGWSLVLKPASKGLEKVFLHLELQGDSAVRKVHIAEATGDTTDIVLVPGP